MRLRSIAPVLLAALLLAPLAHAQEAPPAQAPAGAQSTPAPAAAASVARPDRPSLDDIRNFTRVYEIIRQAYVEKVDNKALMNAAIAGMLAQLDPHSAYLDREDMQELTEDTTGEYSGLGIVVVASDGHLKVVSPIDDTPAARAGIEPGDTILEIDGKPVEADAVNASIDQLRGKPGTTIVLTLVHPRASKPVTLTLTRERISLTSVKTHEIEPGYAYIRISQFQRDTAADLERKVRALIAKHGPQKGAILDLRSNPGGLLTAAVGVSDTFLDGGAIVSTRGRVPDANMRFEAHAGDLLDGAPMVLLVNHGTASAAEIVSGALQDQHRALVMGRRTFGKGVVQTVMPVDADHALKLTTARYYTPDGTSIQARGITPDITIPDLVANKGDSGPTLIGSEADLPHHLANENATPGMAQAARAASSQTLAHSSELAERDYALSQALNVLKGLVLARRQPASPTAQ